MEPMNICWTSLALAGALVASGCEPAGAALEESISDRGGFLDPELRLAPDPDGHYCASEVLRARYDETFETLRIADARVMLGCCGQRSLTVQRVDSLIEITERDDPDGGRCDTVCAFDFAVTVLAVPPLPHVVRLLRDVTDAQGGPELIWRGELHADAGGLAVHLDPTPAPGCRDVPQ
ncbi:MAG: hypothetical protein IT372_36580 [Polyangiaceae bacterium]|nr:hypothetical protein [Polyangiaceae bacterium]